MTETIAMFDLPAGKATAMNAEQRATFKERLLDQQKEISSRAEHLATAIDEQETPPGEHERRIIPAGPTEPDWMAEQVAEQLGGQIFRALERMSLGTYGTCERCGKSIPLTRLKAVPYSDFCVACSALTD